MTKYTIPDKHNVLDFALEGELMVEVKNLDGSCSLWIYNCCWPESKPEELGSYADIVSLMRSAVVNMDRMDAMCI